MTAGTENFNQSKKKQKKTSFKSSNYYPVLLGDLMVGRSGFDIPSTAKQAYIFDRKGTFSGKLCYHKDFSTAEAAVC